MSYRILALNLGSTSTKVSVFQDERVEFHEKIEHSPQDLAHFASVWDQYAYRKEALLKLLESKGFGITDFDVIASRGGNIKPVPGGVYEITSAMLQDMQSGKYGLHPCNVGCLITYDLSQKIAKPGVLIDPPVTDELCPEARLTGIPEITRQSSFHALNQKATARRLAKALGKSYQDVNVIICHLGGGISVGAHLKGRVVDVNNALDGDGPMAPERAGSVPTGSLIDLCYSGRLSHAEMRKKITGKGGWAAHLGTTDGREVVRRMEKNDALASSILKTTCYQIAKYASAMAVPLGGEIDAIGLTGSLAYSHIIVSELKKLMGFIAPIHLFPGENEMDALGAGALRFLRGEETSMTYQA